MKLDNFSKILLATSTINYLASSLDSVTKQIQSLKEDDVFAYRIHTSNEILNNAVISLGQIMEALGEGLNNMDSVCPIDERVTSPAFDIIIHGKDDTEL